MPLISSLGVMNAPNFGLDANKKSALQYIAYGGGNTPYVGAKLWVNGWSTTMTNPATLPTAASYYGVEFDSTNSYLAVTYGATPYINVYAWSNGFGAKYANPATVPPSNTKTPIFSKTSTALICFNDTSPFLAAYNWSSAGFGTKYANPATTPPVALAKIHLNTAGDVIALATTATPFIAAYVWSDSTGFGTKFANPATQITGTGYTGKDVRFNNAGNVLALAFNGGPYANAYAWSNGFGTKYATASYDNGLGSNILRIRFNNAGTCIFYTSADTGTSPSVYYWSNGFSASRPASSTASGCRSNNAMELSKDNSVMLCAGDTTPRLSAVPWVNDIDGFGTKLTDPTGVTITYINSITSTF